MPSLETPIRIDAHHHLWRYTPEEYGWLEGELAPLQRDFTPEQLCAAMSSADVTAALAVQARQTIAETDWLLAHADAVPQIAGVVGWLPIAEDGFQEQLHRLLDQPRLRGLRHVVQAEPSGFLDRADFNRGMQALAGTGLVYDILIHQHQLQEAARFVDRHPSQSFVLDHLAKPGIARHEMEPWATQLRELARRPNVVCKVSGMVTEAGAAWTAAQLEPYFDVALEAFTPDRLMVGSDWPVLTAHCEYAAWWKLVASWVAALSPSEQTAMLGGTALRTYNLSLPETVTRVFTSTPASM